MTNTIVWAIEAIVIAFTVCLWITATIMQHRERAARERLDKIGAKNSAKTPFES
jgi:hypothetical protein